MINRKLDSNGDYSFGQNNSDMLKGVDAVAQAIKTKLLLFQAEWWEDQNDGLPLFQSIIGQYNLEDVKVAASRLLSDRIKDVKEVLSVIESSVNINEKERSISYKYVVNTTEGTISEEVNLLWLTLLLI